MTVSAGLIMYQFRKKELEMFLVHPGGPYWKNKDKWGIPKGKRDEGEDTFEAACREFEEETGLVLPEGLGYTFIGSVKTKGNKKTVYAWAFMNPFGKKVKVIPERISTFTMEHPNGSGIINEYPEIDKGKFFSVEKAPSKMHKYQVPLIGCFREAIYFSRRQL